MTDINEWTPLRDEEDRERTRDKNGKRAEPQDGPLSNNPNGNRDGNGGRLSTHSIMNQRR
ncbi:hypothetical protein KC723_02090 [Candidatus Kaiserbacteria bacterium]|nr:hypothetical protein [Candidatus Kaiserbacteria bacterium]